MDNLNNLSSVDNMSNLLMQKSMTSIKGNINSIAPKKSEFDKMMSAHTINNNKKFDEKNLNKNEKKLYDSCVEMESFLWKQVLNAMKKTINKYKLIDGGMAEEIFSDMLYNNYSMSLAKNTNTGLSKQMYDQLSKYL